MLQRFDNSLLPNLSPSPSPASLTYIAPPKFSALFDSIVTFWRMIVAGLFAETETAPPLENAPLSENVERSIVI